MSKKEHLYLRVRKLIDPETGAVVPALIPAGAADSSILREKGVKTGALVRASITRPRNVEFHMLAHRLSDLVRQNIQEFHGMGSHEALKELQRQAEVECEVTLTEIPGLGTLRSVSPRSIAFDAMDQSDFFHMIRRISTLIAERYWTDLTPEQIEDMAKVMPQEG